MLDELGRANISASGPVLFWQTLSSVDLRPMTREGALNDLPDAYKDVLKEKVMG
jgi:hypothetical protein